MVIHSSIDSDFVGRQSMISNPLPSARAILLTVKLNRVFSFSVFLLTVQFEWQGYRPQGERGYEPSLYLRPITVTFWGRVTRDYFYTHRHFLFSLYLYFM